MAERFDGKVVWITGGGTGIGRAMALEFGRLGASLAISGRREDRLSEAISALTAQGTPCLAVACDVTDEASQKAAVAKIVGHFGHLDIAVANAGFGVNGRLEDLTDADWRRQFDTNVFGLLSTIRVAWPELKKTRGQVVLISSVAGYVNLPMAGAYSASKHAVRAIGETLSHEMKGTGMCCTVVNPGFVESEIGQVDNRGRHHATAKDKRPQRVMWTSEAAAKVIIPAIARRKREFTFTGHGKFGVFMVRHFPNFTFWVKNQIKVPPTKPKVTDP